MENYIIRSKARRQLKDRMGLAVRTILLSTILLNIVNVMLDIIDDNILPFYILFAIGYLFISAPIQAGRCKFLLNMVQGKEEPKLLDLFSQFNIFLKVFAMGLIIFIMEAVIMLIPMLIIFITKGSLIEGVMNVKLSVSSVSLIFISSFAVSIFLLIIQIIMNTKIILINLVCQIRRNLLVDKHFGNFFVADFFQNFIFIQPQKC